MARRSLIDRYQELMEQQGEGWLHNNPCNMVLSTVGLDRSYVRNEFELDVTPLNRFIKKMFPFVIDISYLKVNESKYTDGRRILDNPQIKLIVSPTHRTELYSEDIEYKVKNRIREKLIPLLRTMYEISPGFGLEIYFGSERSETILEHLD